MADSADDPELRICPLTRRQALIAAERARRPQEFDAPAGAGETAIAPQDCPFCAGRESETPPAVMEVSDEAGGWQVRVVPNKYPAIVTPNGAHEVVIESPRHLRDVTEFSAEAFARVLCVYRDRLAANLATPGVEHVSLFKNSGAAAGASLEHVHTQIMALPIVPAAVRTELERAAEGHREQGVCGPCAWVSNERREGDRIVAESDRFIVMAAFAGRQPYETWVMATNHEARFERLDDDAACELAEVLLDVIGRLHRLIADLSYNLVLHTAPRDRHWDEFYHWRWELIPRTTRLAGLELGSGVFINSLPPEDAAEHLRASG